MTSELAIYLMRSLLSEGKIRYETVEKTSQGLQPKLIERAGPTGLILTTTGANLHPENETRHAVAHGPRRSAPDGGGAAVACASVPRRRETTSPTSLPGRRCRPGWSWPAAARSRSPTRMISPSWPIRGRCGCAGTSGRS